MPYTLYVASKSVLDTPYSVKKCLLDSLSVLSEVVSDCDSLMQRLEMDAVPYFLGLHRLGPSRSILAVFVQDPVGVTHELVCAASTRVRRGDLDQWDFCCWPDDPPASCGQNSDSPV